MKTPPPPLHQLCLAAAISSAVAAVGWTLAFLVAGLPFRRAELWWVISQSVVELTLVVWLALRWVRSAHDAVRAAAVLVLVLPVTFLLGLARWSLLPEALVTRAPWTPGTAENMLATPLPFVALGALWFWRRFTWKILGAVTALALPTLVYLAWDEAPAPSSMNLATLVPLPPDGAESHAVAMRFSTGKVRLALWPQPPRPFAYVTHPAEADEWRVFLAVNRDAIRADWAAAERARAWIRDLDAFAVIGEANASPADAPMDWYGFRDTVGLHCAYACLLAQEGRGDEAIVELRPMLAVSRKLAPAARTLLRRAISHSAEDRCLAAARFILKSAPLSSESLRALVAALEPGEDVAVSCRRAILCECALRLAAWRQPERWGFASFHLSVFTPFLYNRNATAHLALRQAERLAAVAGEGRGEGLRAYAGAAADELRGVSFKNAEGRLVVAHSTAGVAQAVADVWQVESDRRALLADLKSAFAKARAAPE